MNAVPSNIEAEQALLGILLCDPPELDRLTLKPDQFFEPFHGRLFEAAAGLIRSGRSVDPMLIADRFKRDPAFDELGGARYLANLVDSAPPSANAPDYARAITDASLRRRLMTEASALMDAAANTVEQDADELLLEHERRLSELADHGISPHQLITGSEAIELALGHASRFGETPEFRTGLTDLDAMLGGLQRGELTILAGRPGSGKTLAGLGVARTMAERGVGICYLSLEMSAHALGLRLACDVAFQRGGFHRPWGGPTMAALSTGNATTAEINAVSDARQAVAEWPLRIDCRAGLTLSKIEQAARRQFRDWRRQGVEPGPVFVDHLGLIRPEKDRQGSRHAEVADVSRGLAEMAKRLNVPVLALCQLNRGVEGREDKRPLLSDLRQAGELEEDARVVLLLHRPAYYFRAPERGETFEQEAERLAREDKDRNLLRIIVAKNSNGPTGDVECFVDVSRSAVRDREARP